MPSDPETLNELQYVQGKWEDEILAPALAERRERMGEFTTTGFLPIERHQSRTSEYPRHSAFLQRVEKSQLLILDRHEEKVVDARRGHAGNIDGLSRKRRNHVLAAFIFTNGRKVDAQLPQLRAVEFHDSHMHADFFGRIGGDLQLVDFLLQSLALGEFLTEQ